MSDPAYLTDTIRRWKRSPQQFVRECIGVVPDKWQDLALGYAGNPATRRLALKACKGPGKTAVLAWIILWFLATHVESKVGCTSITEGNIDSNLWPEIYKWMSRSKFLSAAFVWTSAKVSRRSNPNWFAVKRTWPKSGDSQQQADALAGLHADDVMFVLDEVGGIPQAVMVTAEAVLSGGDINGRAFVVIAGNPTHTSGPLHRACSQDRKLWAVVTITGDPENPLRSPRISLKWAQEQIDSYGRDNPWVMVNVLGEFPPSSLNALLGVEDVEKAMHRAIPPDAYTFMQKRIGVDVARFGDDRTVIFPRQGLMSWKPQIMRNARTTTIAARVARGIENFGREGTSDVLAFVDDTGHWGHGVIDNLFAAGYPVIPVVYSDPAANPRYRNVRASNWLGMADWVKGGGALPYVPELVPELTEITYTFVGGRFQLEDKDLFKARLGYSPDMGDALSETFAMPDLPADMARALGRSNTAKRDFDPYALPEGLEPEQARGGRAMRDFNPLG